MVKACEDMIPRSGEEGEKVDCYTVAIDKDSEPYFLLKKYENQTLVGKVWNGNQYSGAHELKISDIEGGTLRITHFYGVNKIRYDSVYDFVFNHITKFVYIKVNIYRYLESTYQYLFNRRKLITKKRLELLQFMLNDQLDREHKGIRILNLMTKLYSINWVLHPSADEQQEKLQMYLESLLSSGEIKKINDEYIVTGKAINTIELYEEQERRHVEAVKLQRKMVWLTLLLTIMAILQAGIVKLPTILDLSQKNTKDLEHTILKNKKQ